MKFVAPEPWDAITRDVSKVGRRSVIAVVAYVGSDAPKVMPLRDGDLLVCDASPAAIRAGSTSAKALRAYRRAGVEIFSIEGLHTKVILGSRWAWIGSANASANSRDHLYEASVRVTDAATLRRVKAWAVGLCTEDARLRPRDITELAALPVRRQRPGPQRRIASVELPDASAIKFLIQTEWGASERANRTAEKVRSEVRKATRQRGFASSLSSIEFKGELCPLRIGNWVVELIEGSPQRPSQVVSITKISRTWSIAWLASVKTERRPAFGDLLQAIDVTREQWDEERSPFPLRPKHRQAVLDLYR